MTEHSTEVDGLTATWTRDSTAIQIKHVRNEIHTICSFPPGTDLATARESHPELASLWDRIRREFWDGYTTLRFRGHTDQSSR